MKLPPILEGESRARLIQGAVAGAIATMVIGFGWGGWLLQSTSQERTETKVKAAVVAALAPICVDRFRHASDSAAKLVALKATDSWKQEDFVAKGGWATFSGSAEPNSGVAEACAGLLSAAEKK
jgi:hypothetical protein